MKSTVAVIVLLSCISLHAANAAVTARRVQARTFCPPDFTLIHDHCYYFSQEVINNWDEAERLCQELAPNALLVNIETVREWKNLKTYLKEEKLDTQNWWIGGSDRDSEGHWTWMGTNKPFSYADWCPKLGNDNAGGLENCAHIRSTTSVPKYPLCWNDLPCTHALESYQLHFICEV